MRLKPDSLPRVRAWAAELTRRRDEVMATLRDETVRVESAFLETSSAGDFLVYYMRVDDEAISRAAVERSTHAIDAYHHAFMNDVVEARTELELLVDFDRARE
jgi:hypothetical protein